MSTAGPAGLDVVDRAIGLTEAGGRNDLAQRLGHTRRRLLDPTVRVLVIGEFKQGKSLLVNALVDAPVCPVDDDVSTAVPTEVRYSRTPVATLVRSTGSSDGIPGNLSGYLAPPKQSRPRQVPRMQEAPT